MRPMIATEPMTASAQVTSPPIGAALAGGAAELTKAGLEVRDRGAARQEPDGPAQGEQPSEGDDERRDADVGDDEALHAADEGPQAEAQRQGDDPQVGQSIPRPRPGNQSVCSSAYDMATKPTMEPTDRSMLRDTMMSTIPVAMIATPDAWTARVTMFAGRRKVPPDWMWKPMRRTPSATSIPKMRRSISVAENARRTAASAPPAPDPSGCSVLPEAGPCRPRSSRRLS